MKQDAPECEPPRRLWTRDEYYRLAELGLLQPDERVELIDGEIWEKVSPQQTPHATAIRLTVQALRNVFGAGFVVDAQMPMTLDNHSEPEPDILVVRGTPRDYEDHHPTPAETLLLVEVSDTTLRGDRGRKARLYAKAGITDYWIVNLPERVLEVRRDPNASGEYGSLLTLTEHETVSPLAAPLSSARVADLLPKPRP